MKIDKVTIKIENDAGDVVEFVSIAPAPRGDNPAFMNRQLTTALEDLSGRSHEYLGIFAKQYTPADERLDQLHARRVQERSI